MELKTVFKTLVIVDLLLFVFLIIEMFFQSEEVATISDQLSFGIFNTAESEMIGVVLAFILIFIYVISLILLYLFINIGKYLFTFSFVATLLYALVSGPMISTSLGYTLDWLEGATEGAILILLYCSPVFGDAQNKQESPSNDFEIIAKQKPMKDK